MVFEQHADPDTCDCSHTESQIQKQGNLSHMHSTTRKRETSIEESVRKICHCQRIEQEPMIHCKRASGGTMREQRKT